MDWRAWRTTKWGVIVSTILGFVQYAPEYFEKVPLVKDLVDYLALVGIIGLSAALDVTKKKNANGNPK